VTNDARKVSDCPNTTGKKVTGHQYVIKPAYSGMAEQRQSSLTTVPTELILLCVKQFTPLCYMFGLGMYEIYFTVREKNVFSYTTHFGPGLYQFILLCVKQFIPLCYMFRPWLIPNLFYCEHCIGILSAAICNTVTIQRQKN
jgi:hypothetical protein